MAPGIDDGAPDLETSLAMARCAVEDGITVVACTPHIFPGLYENTGPQIRAAVAALQAELDANEIPLTLTTGADVQLCVDLVAGLRSGRILSLGDTRYFLFEPPHHTAPPRIEDTVFAAMAAGYHPIITHPERLHWIESHYETMVRIAKAGAWMQLDRAVPKHGAAAVEAVRTVLRLLVLFALVTPFWSLFDQKASTWIVQANTMHSPLLSLFGWEFTLLPAQMQAVNPILVMLLIPFNNLALFPLMRAIGITPTPLRRMGMGIALSALAWVVVGLLQLQLDGGDKVSILWQLLPYALLTLGEVLVSATGLEFAYSQAPATMKGIILSFWYLAVTVGNLWVLIVNSGVKHPAVSAHIASSGMSPIAFQMFFFAAFAMLVAALFALYATRYKMKVISQFLSLPLWRPGARLMRTLRLPGKFLLISVSFLIPLIWLFYSYNAAAMLDL
eukprot:gene13527-13310_t